MILCLDAGNTRLKCGLHDGQNWRAQQAFGYEVLLDLASVLAVWSSEASAVIPGRIIACNVAGTAVRTQIEQAAQQWGISVTWLESTVACCGVRNSYDSPAQLGADRWAGLIAARALSAEAAIVVQAGTATTIDVMDAEGEFQGGLILPGLALMRRLLAENTSQLSNVSGHFKALPKNTNDAIESGALHATLGAIERMRHLHGPAQCVLSGGAATALLPHLATPVRQIDYLVLEGLLQLARASELI